MHPWLAHHEVAYRQAERRRDADGTRLAHRAHPALARPVTSTRARFGALLVRAGEALGASPNASPSAARSGRQTAR